MSNGTADFKGQCGECKSGYYTATCTGGMQVGQSATVNGNSPQACVVANDGGTVYGIELQTVAGIYDYQVRVDAKGPKGIGSGSMYLAFEDQTGDIYYLSIYSSTREWHQVSYNSSKPALVKIFWSDYSFTASDAAASGEKPAYKVESSVA
jgi:hypothetical protein